MGSLIKRGTFAKDTTDFDAAEGSRLAIASKQAAKKNCELAAAVLIHHLLITAHLTGT